VQRSKLNLRQMAKANRRAGAERIDRGDHAVPHVAEVAAGSERIRDEG
jgi:hypothetical protein